MNKTLLFLLVICSLSVSPIYALKPIQKVTFQLLNPTLQSFSVVKTVEVKPYKVTIQMGGSFLNLQYDAGDVPAFDFSPPAGIKIEKVFDNGVDVTTQLVNNVYTLKPINANVLLVVVVSIDNSTGLQEPEKQFEIVRSNKKITIKNLQAGQDVELIDITGKLIDVRKSNGETISINTEKSGVYVLRINKRSYKLVI